MEKSQIGQVDLYWMMARSVPPNMLPCALLPYPCPTPSLMEALLRLVVQKLDVCDSVSVSILFDAENEGSILESARDRASHSQATGLTSDSLANITAIGGSFSDIESDSARPSVMSPPFLLRK